MSLMMFHTQGPLEKRALGKLSGAGGLQEPPAKVQGCGEMGITAWTVPRGKACVVAASREAG